jgi:hypothetical protein
MNIETDVMAQIRAWHLEERQSTIKRTFALGDMIVSAVIHTGLSENEIIRRIMHDLGELALGMTSYNRAARISRVFTQNQREVLCDKLVSLEKAEVLAGAHWDGRRRTAMIERIKSGKTKSPWGSIQGLYEETGKTRKGKITLRERVREAHADSANNPDCVRIANRGLPLEDEAAKLVFQRIAQVYGVERFGRLAEQARRELAAR